MDFSNRKISTVFLAIHFGFASSAIAADAKLTQICVDGYAAVASAEPRFSREVLFQKREELKNGVYLATDRDSGRVFRVRSEMKPLETPTAKSQWVTEGKIEFWGTPEDGVGEPVLIARRQYKYRTDAHSLETSNVWVAPEFRRQALGIVTLGSVLEPFPQLRTVNGYLADQNSKVFLATLRAARAAKSKDPIGEAFRAAPGYQSLEAWGYGVIDRKESFYDPTETSSPHQIFMVVKKAP